jgi:hypothetical protein
MGMTEHMGVVEQRKVNTQVKNNWGITQNTKMNECKKRCKKQITLMHAHKRMDDK